jgi:hypothetical protein
MTNWAAVGFTATVSLLIPAAWHTTAADLPVDGALVKPPIESFEVDGVTVKVEADRGAVASGGEVHLKLVAISDKPQKLAVTVREQTTAAYPGDRVERAPETLSTRELHLVSGPGGGKPQEIAFRLPASRGKKGGVKQYSFLVQPTKGGTGDHDEDIAALVSVITHDPEAYSVSIEAPADVVAGKAFEIAVRVKNPGKQALRNVHVELSPAPEVLYANRGGMGPGVYSGAENPDLAVKAVGGGEDDEALSIASLAPGEEKVLHYKVEPGKPLPRYALMATAWSSDGGNALDWKSIETPAAVATK